MPNTVFICPNGHEPCAINPTGYQWFDLTKEDALHSYNRHLVSYLKTYERMGLQAIPMRADSGPIGGDNTHEFLVLAETGESEVFYDSKVTDLTFGDRDIDYNDKAACQSVLDEFTSLYARTDETHDPKLFAESPQITLDHVFHQS